MEQKRDVTQVRLCRLESVGGRSVACTTKRCAFWERGDRAQKSRCAFDGLDCSGRPDFAQWLLDIRTAVETASTESEEARARREFYRRMNAGRGD
ncbi:MAG: hypothetical protein ACJ75Q_04845 [Gaiellaceae bacterium]